MGLHIADPVKNREGEGGLEREQRAVERELVAGGPHCEEEDGQAANEADNNGGHGTQEDESERCGDLRQREGHRFATVFHVECEALGQAEPDEDGNANPPGSLSGAHVERRRGQKPSARGKEGSRDEEHAVHRTR